jgi:hypothetical protein
MKTPIHMLVAVGVGTFACGDRSYVYTPETSNAVTGGLPAARTPIPQEKPQGAVEVASYGVTQLQQGDARVPALHVRMIVTNDGDDTPWQLDTSQQFVEIPGEGRSAALYVNSDVQTLPKVTIARHERRVLDFYFPLPQTISGDAQLPRFEMLWQVTTPARTVASRTSFDRLEQQPQVAYAYDMRWPYWAGYGPYWWYDPLYPRVVFIHARPIVIRDHRSHVVVGRFDGHFRPRVIHRDRRR